MALLLVAVTLASVESHSFTFRKRRVSFSTWHHVSFRCLTGYLSDRRVPRFRLLSCRAAACHVSVNFHGGADEGLDDEADSVTVDEADLYVLEVASFQRSLLIRKCD